MAPWLINQVVDIIAITKDWVVIISHNRFEGANQVDRRRVARGIKIVSIVRG